MADNNLSYHPNYNGAIPPPPPELPPPELPPPELHHALPALEEPLVNNPTRSIRPGKRPLEPSVYSDDHDTNKAQRQNDIKGGRSRKYKKSRKSYRKSYRKSRKSIKNKKSKK